MPRPKKKPPETRSAEELLAAVTKLSEDAIHAGYRAQDDEQARLAGEAQETATAALTRVPELAQELCGLAAHKLKTGAALEAFDALARAQAHLAILQQIVAKAAQANAPLPKATCSKK